VVKVSEMKAITLQDGEKIYVDPEDYERVTSHVWYRIYSGNSKLVATYIDKNNKVIHLPTFIMGKTATQIKPGNNFSKNNLTTTNIGRYRQPKSISTSKYKGVSWSKERSLWHAGIRHQGKNIFLGRFKNEDDAGQAYNNAVDKYWEGKGFKNVIGCDNRTPKRTYRTDPRFNNLSIEQKGTSSKYRGVTYRSRTNKYQVHFMFNGKKHTLEYADFKTQEQAGLVYNKCVMYLYGNDARLNEIPVTDELKEFISNYEIPNRIRKLKEI